MERATVAKNGCPHCGSALQYACTAEIEFDGNRLSYYACGYCETKVSVYTPIAEHTLTTFR
jgi:DNA-directed RNA polymerase subunit RPC12/RpoP